MYTKILTEVPNENERVFDTENLYLNRNNDNIWVTCPRILLMDLSHGLIDCTIFATINMCYFTMHICMHNYFLPGV